jgi:hypothetical protein
LARQVGQLGDALTQGHLKAWVWGKAAAEQQQQGSSAAATEQSGHVMCGQGKEMQ